VTERTPALLGAATVLPVLAAAAVVACAGRGHAARAARGAEFQRLVGGLGLGPATDLARCGRSFDARLAGDCAESLDTAPGGVVPCGHGGAGADR